MQQILWQASGTTEDTIYVILGKLDAEKQFTNIFCPRRGTLWSVLIITIPTAIA